MNISITLHAIQQYKEKSREYDLTDEQAKSTLMLIASRGSIICRRPDDTYEVKYNGKSAVIKRNHELNVVITYLGDGKYRSWCRRTEIRPRYNKRYA
ncbi:MAG: hypothetical protein GX154_11070 [Clostridiales bacterium]|nr:hypothetical protein [Clostridiales bacterium]